MPTHLAIKRAQEFGLDLVEVQPNANPPVAKILDYGKFKYDEKKAQKVKRANAAKVETKAMKFTPKTEKHDLDFKTGHVKRFLEEGNRCQLIVQFKGRERIHPEVGESLLCQVAESLQDVGEALTRPTMEGSRMTMTLAPKR